MNDNPLHLILTGRKRLLVFVCVFLVCTFIVSLLSGVILLKFPASTPALRIITILQDLIMFIIPPVVTAVFVTRLPASLLCIDSKPQLKPMIWAILAMLCAVPAMNLIIYLNMEVKLPDGIAQYFSEFEAQATETIKLINGPHDIPNLLITILIIGVLTGLSEELIFRGGLQRLLVTAGVNAHVAIWATAIVFSAVHFQFYGFVPRMLLGAFFGYALYWSKTLWLPVILHTLNNTLYTIIEYNNAGSQEPSTIDSIGSGSDYVIVIISVLATTALLRLLYTSTRPHK